MATFDVLIDGSHLAHRANHVFHSLRSSSYEPTGLIYGFLKSLLPLTERFKPKGGRLVVFWDSSPIVKKSLFPEYKAQRKKENFSEFSAQLDRLKEILFPLGVGQAQVEHEEADDLISSYINLNRKKVKKFIVYSADRDFLQLVDTQVIVIKPKMGKYPEVIYDEKKVLEEFGIVPKGIVFLKVLTGDSSDNIPGVSRLPKKQVAKILSRVHLNGYQTLDQIFENLDTYDFLTENQTTKIKAFYDQSFKNFELIKLKEHLDITVKQEPFDQEGLKECFHKIEFFAFLKEFDRWANLFGGGQE